MGVTNNYFENFNEWLAANPDKNNEGDIKKQIDKVFKKSSMEFKDCFFWFIKNSNLTDSIISKIDHILKADGISDSEKIKNLIFCKIELEKFLVFAPQYFPILFNKENSEDYREDYNINLTIVHKIRLEQILANFYATKKIVDMSEEIFNLKIKINPRKTKFTNAQINILFKLLESEDIVISSKNEASMAFSMLTGASQNTLVQAFSKSLKKENFIKSDITTVKTKLQEMIKLLDDILK